MRLLLQLMTNQLLEFIMTQLVNLQSREIKQICSMINICQELHNNDRGLAGVASRSKLRYFDLQDRKPVGIGIPQDQYGFDLEETYSVGKFSRVATIHMFDSQEWCQDTHTVVAKLVPYLPFSFWNKFHTLWGQFHSHKNQEPAQLLAPMPYFTKQQIGAIYSPNNSSLHSHV